MARDNRVFNTTSLQPLATAQGHHPNQACRHHRQLMCGHPRLPSAPLQDPPARPPSPYTHSQRGTADQHGRICWCRACHLSQSSTIDYGAGSGVLSFALSTRDRNCGHVIWHPPLRIQTPSRQPRSVERGQLQRSESKSTSRMTMHVRMASTCKIICLGLTRLTTRRRASWWGRCNTNATWTDRYVRSQTRWTGICTTCARQIYHESLHCTIMVAAVILWSPWGHTHSNKPHCVTVLSMDVFWKVKI